MIYHHRACDLRASEMTHRAFIETNRVFEDINLNLIEVVQMGTHCDGAGPTTLGCSVYS